MAVTAKLATGPRWHQTFVEPDSLADDLGATGAWVGPRTGPDKRTHGQKEDYVLRRLLVAWRECDRLPFPFEITAATDEPGEPDYMIAWSDGDKLGVEVAEAGDEDYQAWLTHSEKRPANEVELFSKDGFVGDGPEKKTLNDILKAIDAKNKKFLEGAYQTATACDLVVYDNSEWGGFLDKQQLSTALRSRDSDFIQFRRIHLVAGETVFLDLFGNQSRRVDVGNIYEIDYAAWVFDQIDRMRGVDSAGLDLNHVAEELADLGRSERRALGSHLRNLMFHLLKWEFQPKRRGSSWQITIDNTRSEIYELLTEMPSLRTQLRTRISSEYKRARRDAAKGTGMEIEQFPVVCPYADEQLIDPEFLPGETD